MSSDKRPVTINKNSYWSFLSLSTWNLKDTISTIFALFAFVISVISLSLQFRTQAKENETLVNVSAAELDNRIIEFIPFPEGDLDPFPGTKGFIKIPVVIKIDNLSKHRVSIKSINATPIANDPDDNTMTPFVTNGPGVVTDFNGALYTKDNIEISLPLSLGQGESIDVYGIIGYPLDNRLTDIISNTLSLNQSPLTLIDIKRTVENQGYTLNRSVRSDYRVENSNIVYRINVLTSYNTRHKFILDLNCYHCNDVNWDLLLPDE